ncbi:MAG: SDR family oxidoreductase [Deltaproteobacteria bacterium]|jgi:NAD(P)-dependent dehydrogenase (short-subunit alcohol dehydrogenase family)|nr:SDR family oxidoreductase [Deltaproteobacteria bacterium]
MMLKGKVAVITGASKGIGAATVERFLLEGAKVIGANRNAQEGEKTIAELVKKTGGQAFFIPCDVENTKDIGAVFQAAIERFGGLDILVNNAAWQLNQSILDTTDEQFDRIMAINVRSVFVASREAAKIMVARKTTGSIVSISSNFAIVGSPGYTAYHGTKGAISSFTRAAGISLMPYGIRVNAVCSGTVETPGLYDGARDTGDVEKGMASFKAMQPLKRFGQPNEIASAVTFLASDEASFVYGSNLVVDGGYTVL